MTSSASETPAVAPPVAGVWARFASLLLDGLMWLPLALGTAYATSRSLTWGLVLFPAGLIGFLVYEVWMHARYGATLGKMILGIRVVRNADHAPIDLNIALKRSFVDAVLRLGMAIVFVRILGGSAGALPAGDFVKLMELLQRNKPYATLSNLDSLWTLSEVITCLFNPRRRAVHDLIAGTVVIKSRT